MMTRPAFVAALTAAFFVSPSWGQSDGEMDHSAHVDGHMAEYMATMDTMMTAMDEMTSSGDADADFLLMMLPHHQSAIDMAQVELDQGDDEETQEMARKIIDAQKQEIAEMSEMLERLGIEAPE